jgi:hypothetical protein
MNLEHLARLTFGYFERGMSTANGLVVDNTRRDAPVSIAATGYALACYAVAAERGWIARDVAVRRVTTSLRFFWESDQGGTRDSTGYRGFFFHFLDVDTGRRVWKSELSTIDSAILFAGALTAAEYFDRDTPEERALRSLADAVYRRADWEWSLNGGAAVTHGWTPERGFLRYRWTGYNEALLLYLLAFGSPTHPVPPASYDAWISTYKWRRIYGIEYLHAGPLFIHQGTHVWIDFRGIRDDYMRSVGIDYFENSRRATYVQREYARRNPRGFAGYGENAWGVTASDGPGPARCRTNGRMRSFWAYRARGVPWDADDGTLSPWAVIASLPFAPEIVLPAMEHLEREVPRITGELGYKCSYNPSFCGISSDADGWISQGYFGIDQGPVVLMIENHSSGLIWQLMRRCGYIVDGLRRAGFRGGWLDAGTR